jgi:subtilisin family serine protease
MEQEKEYIVSLKNKEDLDNFYQDMESKCRKKNVPSRKVELCNRRPISRNTHYYLTESEAEKLKNDKRVLSVELTQKDLGFIVNPCWIQQSNNFQRNSSASTNHINWGLLRTNIKNNIPNWGAELTNQSSTIYSTDEGLNVDIVISDGKIDPTHPEFSKNEDGTGGSRVIQYNWFQHRNLVEGLPNSTYLYEPYVSANVGRTNNNAHGIHVAGTAAGNRQGFARKSNIYNIDPYSSDINNVDIIYHIDYIRAFHNTKNINPITKIKNPTIVNMSWGFLSFGPLPSNLISIFYNGVLYNGPFTNYTLLQLWEQFNIVSFGITGPTYLMFKFTPVDVDIEDAINDGIIMVGAAGNNYSRMDVPGGSFYDSYLKWTWGPTDGYFYQRGGSPSTASNVICVGSLNSFLDNNTNKEIKSSFSNFGRRVDIFAPGSDIQSSMINYDSPVQDPRSSLHYLNKYSGTSMASPHVCGVLACLLERYPKLNQQGAIDFLNEKFNSIDNISNPINNIYYSIEDTPNKLLYNYKYRKFELSGINDYNGAAYPCSSIGLRKNKDAKYPRLKRSKII